MYAYSGETAALGAALGWTISALCWTAAGKRIGSMVVNTVRLAIALPFFLIYGYFILGEAIPLSASLHAWLYMGLSGVLGFFICDLCLFRSFLIIGPRLGLLILSLSPLVTAVCGWWWLDERLSPLDIAGMFTALTGVAWVVLESPRSEPEKPRAASIPWQGVALALTGTIAQGVSNVVAKNGLEGMASPVAATQIRLIAGLLCFVILMPLVGRHRDCINTFKDRSTMIILTTGTIAGPTIGVVLLMYAITQIPTGLAMTFTSLSTVMIIPLTAMIHKERISRRAIYGALVACTGSALLLL